MLLMLTGKRVMKIVKMAENRVPMWQEIASRKFSVEVSKEHMPFLIERVRKIVMGELKVLDRGGLQNIVDNFVHVVLNSSKKDEILKLPYEFFYKIGLSDEDREIVDEHFEKKERIPLSNLFGKNDKMIKTARTEVPRGYEPSTSTPYIFSERIIDTTTISARTGRSANKEYIIRVYEYPGERYGVIAFYGRIGGVLQRDWKGFSLRRISAIHRANNYINAKLNDPQKNYERAEESVARQSLPTQGYPANEETRSTSTEPFSETNLEQPAATEDNLIGDATELFAEEKYQEILSNPDFLNVILTIAKDINSLDQELADKIEDFIHFSLNSPLKENVLSQLTLQEIDNIRMTEEDRKIVDEYYRATKEQKDVFQPSSLESLFGQKKNWYRESRNTITNKLTGYFKYGTKSGLNDPGIYDICWKGLGNDLRITSHNMPDELFKEHYNGIQSAAQKKSEEAYQEVTELYAFEK